MGDAVTSTHLVTLTDAEQFFYDHAGYSYDPEREKRTSGKTRTAILLANAERKARRRNWLYEWSIDPNAEITPGDGYYVSGAAHWTVILRDIDGVTLGTLGSIDLGFAHGDCGEPKQPENDPYHRVVQAELAFEAI
jgi:hypothetical protein